MTQILVTSEEEVTTNCYFITNYKQVYKICLYLLVEYKI